MKVFADLDINSPKACISENLYMSRGFKYEFCIPTALRNLFKPITKKKCHCSAKSISSNRCSLDEQ